MGIFKDIKLKYNHYIYDLVRSYQRLTQKKANVLNRRIFLLRCRACGITPSHIQRRFASINEIVAARTPFVRKVDNLVNMFCHKILNVELEVTHWSVNRILKEMDTTFNNLKKLLPTNLFKKLIHICDSEFKRTFNKVKVTNIAKFDKLVASLKSYNFPVQTSVGLVNMSRVAISDDITNILSQGASFAVDMRHVKFPILECIKSLEHIITDNFKDHEANLQRAKSINIISNAVHNSVSRKPDPILKTFMAAKRFIGDHPELIVARADKGGQIAILEASEYESKMMSLLDDTSSYKSIPQDLSIKYENKANSFLRVLLTSGVIDQETFKEYLATNSNPARIYGLIKLHKDGAPLRPVVSCIGSPVYKLSKLVAKFIRSSFPSSSYSVKNSEQFLNKIKEVVLPHNYVLVSLDVKSMFSNLTFDLVERAFEFFAGEFQPVFDISIDMLLELIKFMFDSTFFKYKNKFFSQLKGSAMGNPASPAIAEICMEFVIQSAIRFLNFELPFIHIYVDDICTAIPANRMSDMLMVFNSIDSNIEFTGEIEKLGGLPFLDTFLMRDNRKVVAKWYNKLNSPPTLLNFKSSHPLNQKMGILVGLKNRMFRLSDPRFLPELRTLFTEFALQQHYPKTLINRVLNRNYKKDDSSLNDNIIPPIRFYKFPYIKGVSERLNNVFQKHGIKLAAGNMVKVGTLLSKLKSPIDAEQLHNVVYSIPCSSCPRMYIGTTKNKLFKRLQQHRNDCMPQHVNRVQKTALSSHHFDTGHVFKFSDSKVLHQDNNYRRRMIAEVLFINNNLESCVNFRSDTNNLSSMYSGLLHYWKSVKK